MAYSITDFRTAFPEFSHAPDSLVNQRIEWATNMVDPAVMGNLTNISIGLLTANLIAFTPAGQDMRLKVGNTETTLYLQQYKVLTRIKAGGARLAALQSDVDSLLTYIRAQY